ncbi:hypothetical protein JW898_02720 [Candidatus Woesearchaeota archaeon]|nr:hypothetical protein [Candidatus Woesearchaeota archaeon]
MFLKAQIWVSAILYILVITVVMVLVLNAGVPVLKDLQDKTVFTRSKNTFLNLNQQINEISEEGVGSQRVVPIEIEKGNLELRDGSLKWDLKTNAKILESGQQIELGNLYISSNADVSSRAFDENYTLQNNYLTATFYKCEDRELCMMNESGMIMQLVFTNPETGVQTAAGSTFEFHFNSSASWDTPGFSVLEDEGSSLGAARVLYYVNNTGANYYTVVEFTLESNRDFLQARIR